MEALICVTIQQATRKETDSFGEIEVPADRYYGAQTARSKLNFPIGDESENMPVSKLFLLLNSYKTLFTNLRVKMIIHYNDNKELLLYLSDSTRAVIG